MNIPYNIVKVLLLPFGLKNIAYIWTEFFAYNKIKRLYKWTSVSPNTDFLFINKNVKFNKTMWVYWKQGLDSAPLLVKKCIESQKRHKRDWDYIFLSEANIHNYVKLPAYIEEKHNSKKIGEAHYSDLLRIQLLIQYGGIWMDSTCFLSEEIPDYIENSDFFMFSTGNWWPWLITPSKSSNWFIKSKQNNELLIKTRNFLFEHWKNRNKPIHYFVFHLIFSILVDNDDSCKKIWEKVPFVSNLQPHLFQYSFYKEYDKTSYDYILKQCFIHKLNYKYSSNLISCLEYNNLKRFLDN